MAFLGVVEFHAQHDSGGATGSAAFCTGKRRLDQAAADCADDHTPDADDRDECGFLHGWHRTSMWA
jgi:hypothetical protein